MKIVVLGAGAWGTAMAISAANHPDGHAVTLCARDAAQAAHMQATRSMPVICRTATCRPPWPWPAAMLRRWRTALIRHRRHAHGGSAWHAGAVARCRRPWPGCAKALRPMPETRAIRACWRTRCVPRWRPTWCLAYSAAPALRRKWPAPSPPPWWLPANTPVCAMPWWRPSTAPACVCTPTTTSWVWRWAVP